MHAMATTLYFQPNDASAFGSHPAVFLGHNPETLPKSCLLVSNDQRETARAAARELLATGYGNFAFVNVAEGKKWSELRERGFAEALAIHGMKCAVFRAEAASGGGTSWMKALRRFVAALKKPCGLNARRSFCATHPFSLRRFPTSAASPTPTR